MGEVVSWPKISFLPTEPDILRGSQLWETLEEEDSKAKLAITTQSKAKKTADPPQRPWHAKGIHYIRHRGMALLKNWLE